MGQSIICGYVISRGVRERSDVTGCLPNTGKKRGCATHWAGGGGGGPRKIFGMDT
jgi:hypothetical protein